MYVCLYNVSISAASFLTIKDQHEENILATQWLVTEIQLMIILHV